MATARHLHRLGATIDITIPANGVIPDSQGFLWVADGTDIEWTNETSGEVQIVFTIGAINNITVGNGLTSNPISESEIAVNYVLEDANGNPLSDNIYCIQWGNGVLPISVSANSAPFVVAVPAYASLAATGKIQFSADANYTIKWYDENNIQVSPWTPAATEVYKTNPNQPNPNKIEQAVLNAPTPVTCEFTPYPFNVPGGGKVLIGSSN